MTEQNKNGTINCVLHQVELREKKAHWKVNNKLWETNKAVVKLPKKIERESVKNRAENSNKNLIFDYWFWL